MSEQTMLEMEKLHVEPTMSPCDAWHVSGAKWAHTNADDAAIIAACRAKLPRVDFQCKIGWTGYIDWERDPFGQYGWSQDETGRDIIVVGDWWGFRRYTQGDVMAWYHISQPAYVQCSTETIREQIQTALNNYVV